VKKRYYLDIFGTDGKCIIPGWTSQDSLYESDSPLPIPNVGETLEVYTGRWQVKERRFYYNTDEENVTSVKVVLTVSKFS
jgi:hypothetical protein